MPIITISRGSLSGGASLAERLGKRLGHKVISREVIVEAAKKYGVSEAELAKGMKSPPSLWGRLSKQQEQFILAVRATLADMVVDGDVVYHGQAGQLLLKDLPKVIKLRLIAPLEYRVRAAMNQRNLSRDEALAYIQRVDAERTQWVRHLYNVEWSDPSLYDLVINLEHMSLDSAVEIVADLVNRKEYQRTAESDQELRDFALSTRVQAALAFQSGFPEGAVDARARLGVVRLRGGRFFEKNRDTVVQFVKAVPGVTEIVAEGEETPGISATEAPRDMKASDLMIPISGYPHVGPATSIRETMGALGTSSVKLKDGHLISPRYVLVLDELDRPVGIVSRRDLLAGLTPQLQTLERARGEVATMVHMYDLHQAMTFRWSNLFSNAAINNSREPVKTILTPVRGTVNLDDDLSVVVTTMIHYRFDLVPVMDRDRVAGVVLMTDIFDTVAQFILEHRGPGHSEGSA